MKKEKSPHTINSSQNNHSGEWRECKLGEVAEVKYGKSHQTLADGNIPAYGSGGLVRHVEKPLYEDESILIPRKGTLNNIIYKNEPFWTVDTMFYTKLDKEKVFSKFLFYQLSIVDFANMNVGSAVPSMTVQVLNDLDILLPPLPEQQAIAEVLSSLDDKIDLLHRQNKTLEQLAETLFRKWFIEEAEESWEVGTIDDVVSMKGGATPSTTEQKYWDGNIHWTSPRDLSNTASIFLFDTSRKITEEGLKQINSGLLPVGTLLLSSRAPIGYLALTEIPVAINQGYIAIICNKLVSNYFMFLWCRANMEMIENAGNGSVFQEISKSAFRTLDFLIPPKEKLKHFDKEIESLFQKIKSNTQQIRTLTQLRDTLLPKLMSGEIRVKIN